VSMRRMATEIWFVVVHQLKRIWSVRFIKQNSKIKIPNSKNRVWNFCFTNGVDIREFFSLHKILLSLVSFNIIF
jgi:hypothetical protein